MTDFKIFADAVERRFSELSQHELFVVDAPDLFDAYLAAFPEGTNPIHIKRTVHDCSCCKNFVRNLGRVVAIIDGRRYTVWETAAQVLPEPFATVAARMDAIIRQQPIVSVFRTKERKYGHAHNYGDNDIRYDHFVGHITTKHFSTEPATARGEKDAIFQVLDRGLRELTLDAVATVQHLIESKALYRGDEHLAAVTSFRHMIGDYHLADDKKLFVWANLDHRFARFRNTVIGSLIIDLSDGVDLEQAVKSFETKVAPQNYKRPTALITPRMIDDAVAKLDSLGLSDAIERRYARLGDVSVNNVLFVDNAARGKMRNGVAGLLMEAVKPQPVNVSAAVEIDIDVFFADIVPQATSIDVLVENRHLSNFVSLTAPVHQDHGADAGRLFRWDNGFAWSYDGDVADSMKQRVKRAGGNIEADLRVSLAWSNEDDLDLHAKTPRGEHIHYGYKAGILDVDMNAPGTTRTREPVENMAFMRPADGDYLFWVNQYQRRESVDVGFDIEVECGGVLHRYRYDRAVTGDVKCFVIRMRGGKIESIPNSNNDLTASSSSVSKWGVSTETLIPVDTIMASPNHWDGQATGNKHWFFFLKGCANPDSTRGIYNEFLRPEFEPHRKVFEILGAKTKCPPASEQLSGVGFSSTRSDTVTVVVKGANINRAFNIAF